MPIAAINASAAGDTTIVTGVASFRFLIKKLILTTSGAVNAKFRSSGNDLTGLLYLKANDSFRLDDYYEDQESWLTTNVGEDFRVNLSGAVAVGGWLIYEKQPA